MERANKEQISTEFKISPRAPLERVAIGYLIGCVYHLAPQLFVEYGSIRCHSLAFRGSRRMDATNDTHSLSASATVHLYCAVENRQMSANCLTDTLIFFTVRLLLFAMCTFTAIFSP